MSGRGTEKDEALAENCLSGDECRWSCGAHSDPMAYVEAKGFIDYPTAWKIARRTESEYHHNRCSFNATSGVILCDCDVLTKSPEYVLAYGASSADPQDDA